LLLNGARMATAALRLPERWQEGVMREGHAFADCLAISEGDAAREHLLMNLRLTEGLDLAAYEMRWGVTPDAAKIASLAEDGLLTLKENVLRATSQGRLLLNAVISALLN
jgi:oxygen-independent coproporphyrinogen-3 oxidase